MLKKNLFNKLFEARKALIDIIKYRPKQTLSVMILILFLGVIFIFAKKMTNKKRRWDIVKSIDKLDSGFTKLDTGSIKSNHSLMDIYSILQIEGKFNEVINKDSLTKEDSLFLKRLNNQLNKMIDEKH